MNIRERLESEIANKQRQYETAIRCSVVATEDLGTLLDIDIPFYANIYAYNRGIQVYVNDNSTSARLAKDPHDAALREAVAAFNGFVSAVMDAAGITELEKKSSGKDLTAGVYIAGHKRGDETIPSHYFSFRWHEACDGRKFRVTKTEEIVICGEPDASQYDSIEEIIE